jgi:hypothetical protein
VVGSVVGIVCGAIGSVVGWVSNGTKGAMAG